MTGLGAYCEAPGRAEAIVHLTPQRLGGPIAPEIWT